MSLKDNDTQMLNKILSNTNDDFHDFVNNFMDFFISSELKSTIPSFQKNLEIINLEFEKMKKSVLDHMKSHNLKSHGLSDSELARKYKIYTIIREDYHSKKIAFVKSFIKLNEMIFHSNTDHEEKNDIKSVNFLPEPIKKFYRYVQTKLRNFKISKERFYQFLNSILKSIADALGIGGIISEYKDSMEVATKKENSIQFNVIVFRNSKLYERMRIYRDDHIRQFW